MPSVRLSPSEAAYLQGVADELDNRPRKGASLFDDPEPERRPNLQAAYLRGSWHVKRQRIIEKYGTFNTSQE